MCACAAPRFQKKARWFAGPVERVEGPKALSGGGNVKASRSTSSAGGFDQGTRSGPEEKSPFLRLPTDDAGRAAVHHRHGHLAHRS